MNCGYNETLKTFTECVNTDALNMIPVNWWKYVFIVLIISFIIGFWVRNTCVEV